MTKTLTRIGNSRGVILDRTMLDHLGVSEGGLVEMTMESGKIVLTAATANPRKRPTIEEAANHTIQHYDDALRRLANAG